ncbi:MAG: S-layer homology domain-containing protein, partial [Bacteroidota bacterium]
MYLFDANRVLLKLTIYCVSLFILLPTLNAHNGHGKHEYWSIGDGPVHSTIIHDSPEVKAYFEKEERRIQNFVENFDVKSNSQVIKVPVVFHVLHGGQRQGIFPNISDVMIRTQLEQVNIDFRAANSDKHRVPQMFRNKISNTGFQFCLATVAPNGSSTTGIVRHNRGKKTYTRQEVENIQRATTWDNKKYLNVWIADLPSGSPNGYAYLPHPTPVAQNKDGIVIQPKTVGSIRNPNPNYNYNKGRTLTHEVGHWLNLLHIWGKDRNCQSDDFVTDTPSQEKPSSLCSSERNYSCGSYDMYVNFMDYSRGCRVMFTHGQKARMHASINGSIRRGILTSRGCSRPAPNRNIPNDVKGHWAEEEIAFMLSNRFMSGYPNGTFRPDNPLTRAEFATMLVKVLGISTNTSNAGRFNDISGHWAKTNILSAANAGYVSGYPDGTFRPNDKITKMQVNLAVANIGISGGSWSSFANHFYDDSSVPSWARAAIYKSFANKLIPCYPNIKRYEPNSNSTRANAVVVLYRALKRTTWNSLINPYLALPPGSTTPTPDTTTFATESTSTSKSLKQVSVYPNPARDVLFVDVPNAVETSFEIYGIA